MVEGRRSLHTIQCPIENNNQKGRRREWHAKRSLGRNNLNSALEVEDCKMHMFNVLRTDSVQLNLQETSFQFTKADTVSSQLPRLSD